MFKIIGADQQEYGLVTADQIRQWIIEGRANAATLVQSSADPEWKPLSAFPELSQFLPGSPARALAPPPLPSAPNLGLPPAGVGDADIDIGHCLTRSWLLFKQNAGLLIGATVIFFVVVSVLNQLIALVTKGIVQSLMTGDISAGSIAVLILWNVPQIALTTVLTGGLYALLLKLARGQPAGIGDLFSGFQTAFAQLAISGIVVQMLTFLGVLACIIPGIYVSVAWILTGPLIIDRRMDFWAAMEESRQVVTRRWWPMFCLVVVVALINIAGLLACCVGLLVAFPVGLGAFIYAYEDLFGRAAPAPTI